MLETDIIIISSESAIESGILAAKAIRRDRHYQILSIPCYGFPALLFPHHAVRQAAKL